MMKAAVRFAVHLRMGTTVFTALLKNSFMVMAVRNAYIAVPKVWGITVSTVPTAFMNGKTRLQRRGASPLLQ
jgi:hypothetical protein